jgi:aminomethyltransferase
LEGAILSYCSDITQNDNPWTIGLGRLVDVDKPQPYIGKAALQALARQEPARRLVGVEITGAPLAGNDAFWDVLYEDKLAGHLTRCAYSPRLEKNIGLVNVSMDYASGDTRLTIMASDGPRTAYIVPIPWVQSETQIPKE